MTISLSPQTQKLLEEQMKNGAYASIEDVIRAALETLSHVHPDDYDALDQQTRSAIEEGEAQYQRGEGIPLDDAFARLRQKHPGQ